MTPDAKQKLSDYRPTWRETTESWPSFRISVELAPWHWRFGWYRDDVHPWCCWLRLGPVTLELWA